MNASLYIVMEGFGFSGPELAWGLNLKAANEMSGLRAASL